MLLIATLHSYFSSATIDIFVGELIFHDVVDSIRKEATRLRHTGVNKIIALGHAGLALDQHIAEEVEEVDVVVGGHTHSFLWTGYENELNVRKFLRESVSLTTVLNKQQVFLHYVI